MSTPERIIAVEIERPKIDGATMLVMIWVAVKTMLKAVLNRRAANRLEDLDDYQLRDIGLTRRELRMALRAGGFTSDPTRRLSEIARLHGRRD